MRGPLAQLVEQWTFNPSVVGSIPTGPTTSRCESGFRDEPGFALGAVPTQADSESGIALGPHRKVGSPQVVVEAQVPAFR